MFLQLSIELIIGESSNILSDKFKAIDKTISFPEYSKNVKNKAENSEIFNMNVKEDGLDM